MKLKNIIAATDFSEHAQYALKRAAVLAEQHQAELDLIHVLNKSLLTNFMRFSDADSQQKLFELEKQTEEKLTGLTQSFPSSISLKTSVLLGRAADEIIRFAEPNPESLIVVGAHGEYHISDYVLGTTSGEIVRQGHTPILLIKKNPSFLYKKILIATDLSEVSKKAVEFAFQCFPDADFQLLHIVDIYYQRFLNDDLMLENEASTQDILESLDNFLKSCKVTHEKFEKKIIGGYLADSIVSQSIKWKADLLVFGTQGHSKLHYLLMGSVAKRLLQLSNTDMLAVPPVRTIF